MTFVQVFFYVLACFGIILMIAVAFRRKEPDGPLAEWEWYRPDQEPDPDHNNERGHWVPFVETPPLAPPAASPSDSDTSATIKF